MSQPAMRRIIRLFFPASEPRPAAAQTYSLTPEQHRQLLTLLSDIGLDIVTETRGPVPLLAFGRRVLAKLDAAPTVDPDAVPQFADALKRVIHDMADDRLRVLSPSDFPGVGYVYNAQDPETWPVQSSR
ncbi:MAG TPA: hypothetical protein VK324_16705 [Tepidisphaeraceae bacterium]|nr:hypothetical protein [Tepidisphaeraceae bacterium]